LDVFASNPLPDVLDSKSRVPDALNMTSVPLTEAQAKLSRLLDEASASHEPIQITGKSGNGILLSEEDWRSIEQTLYLLSIPGMRESIRKGMKEPLRKSSRNPGW
jgi:prevent-host-death family protein